jgi:hypothetical protein
VTALKFANPSSRQREQPIIKTANVKIIYMEEKEELVAAPKWWSDTRTD